MVNIQTTEEQIVSDWITNSEEENDNLNSNDFATSGTEILIETTSTSTNQNLLDSNARKRKTSNLTSGNLSID